MKTDPNIIIRKRSATTAHAFTLIELLTVIAIIGILAAILIPVVGSVRESAKSAQCVSNLREWHQAWSLYALDHDDRVVPGNMNVDANGNRTASIHWPGPLGEMAGYEFVDRAIFLDGREDTIGTCPSATIDDDSGAHWINNQNDETRHVAYGYNVEGLGAYFGNGWRSPRSSEFDSSQIGPHGLRLADVSPRTIVIADGTSWHFGAPDYQYLSFRHNGKANFVTAGGSVFSSTELPPIEQWCYGE